VKYPSGQREDATTPGPCGSLPRAWGGERSPWSLQTSNTSAARSEATLKLAPGAPVKLSPELPQRRRDFTGVQVEPNGAWSGIKLSLSRKKRQKQIVKNVYSSRNHKNSAIKEIYRLTFWPSSLIEKHEKTSWSTSSFLLFYRNLSYQ